MATFDPSNVKGNAPDALKTHMLKWHVLGIPDEHFVVDIARRGKVDEVNLDTENVGGGKVRETCTVVATYTVEEDMLNGGDHMHGGCTAFIIDAASNFALMAARDHEGQYGNSGVSQSLNLILHAPATLGTPLRVVSTSVALGGRVSTVRAEMWDMKNERLVASAMHVKMNPSIPKPKL